MAIKSNNTKGNPYHDEGNGQFTSSDKIGSQQFEKNLNIENLPLKLKSGIDLEALKEKVAQMKGNPTAFNSSMFKTISDIEKEGNEIIGSSSNIVGYDDSTNVEVAQELNLALKDIYNVFPELFKNELLIAYGTKYKNTTAGNKKLTIYENLIKQEPFASRIAEFGENEKNAIFYSILLHAYAIEKYFNNTIRFSDGCSGVTSTNKLTTDSLFPINPSTIKFNPEFCKSKERFREVEQRGVRVGAHFPVYDKDKQGSYGTAAHELGHHIDRCLTSLMTQQEKTKRASLIRKGNSSYRDNYSFWSIGDSEISGYAATSGAEQIAEAFSNYFSNGERATQHNKDIVNFYIQVYKRAFSNNEGQ